MLMAFLPVRFLARATPVGQAPGAITPHLPLPALLSGGPIIPLGRAGRDPRPRRTRHSVERLAQQQKALELYTKGHSDQDVADALGVSRAVARALVDEVFRAREADVDDAKRRAKLLAKERLLYALKCLMPKVERGDGYSIGVMVKLEERLALLEGLDAPEEHVHEHRFAGESDDDLRARAAQFGVAFGAGVAVGTLAAAGRVPAGGGAVEQVELPRLLELRDDRQPAGAPPLPPDRGGLAVDAGEHPNPGDGAGGGPAD
jgi:hypothetical protein